MSDYATVADLQKLKRALTVGEAERARAMIPIICDEIREYAKNIGKDFDLMLIEDPYLANIATGVVCDIVMRELNTPGNQLPATSYSETAGSVSQSFSLPNSSGSVKLWPSDLKALGLKRQKLDSINMWTRRRGC